MTTTMRRRMLAVHAPSLSRLSFVILIGTADLLGLSVPGPVSAQTSAPPGALMKEAEDIVRAYKRERAKPESEQSSVKYDELKGRIDLIWTDFMKVSTLSEKGRTLRIEIGTASDWLRGRQREMREARIKAREAAIKAQQWPSDIEEAVVGRQVLVGMTTEQAAMAWGPPLKVNETISASGKAEEWVYRGGARLHFVNGELRAIQTSR
jgi:hypothetical protein